MYAGIGSQNCVTRISGATIVVEEIDGELVVKVFQEDSSPENPTVRIEVIDLGGSHIGEFSADAGDPENDRWVRWA